MAAVSPLSDFITLEHMEPALRDFVPPEGPFDPAGSWRQRWDLYTLTMAYAVAGSLTIERMPTAQGTLLKIDYLKNGTSGYRERAVGEVLLAPDAIGTLKSWKVNSRLENGQGAILADTEMEQEATMDGTAMEVTVNPGGLRRSVPLRNDGRTALNWGLIEAVQRLAPMAVEEEFDLLEHYDQLKPGMRLRPRVSAHVEAGGTARLEEQETQLKKGAIFSPVAIREGAFTMNLRSCEQLGFGIIPTVYWLDGRGRTVFVMAGIEGYILRESQQLEGGDSKWTVQ